MALSIPALKNTTKSTSNNQTSLASTSFTPTANSLMVVVFMCTNGSDTGARNINSCTSTHTGQGSFTEWVDQYQNAGSRETSIAIYTSQTGASPGAGTVTVGWTGSVASRTIILIYEFTGHSTATPVGYYDQNLNALSTLTVTLDGTPTSTSCVFAAVASTSGTTDPGITEGSGFTELTADTTGGSTARVWAEIEYDITSADSTADWSSLALVNNCAGAIEVKEAVTSVTVTLSTKALTLGKPALDVVPGTKTIALSTKALTVNGVKSFIVPIIALKTGSIVSSGVQLDVVPGTVSKILATGALTFTNIALDVVPGAVIKILSTGVLTTSGVVLDIVPGQRTITLNTCTLTTTGISSDIIPGQRTILLSTGSLTSTGIPITIQIVTGVSITLDTIALTTVGISLTVYAPSNEFTYIDGFGGNVNSADDTLISNGWPTFNGGAHANFALASTDPQRALLRFDLSAIDTASECLSAILYLVHSYNAEGGPTATGNVYSLTEDNKDWIAGVGNIRLALEHECCYNAKSADGAGGVDVDWAGGAGCDVSGTDYESDSLGSYTFDPGSPIGTILSITLDADRIKGWFGEENTNYGVIIIPTAGGPHFGQSDNGTTSYRPKLVVTYRLGTSVVLDTGSLTTTGVKSDVIPGSVSKVLDTASLTSVGIASTIYTAAPQSITLNTASLVASGITLDVVPGLVSKQLNTAILTTTGINSTIVPGIVSIILDTGSLTLSGVLFDVVPGLKITLLSTKVLTLTGISSSIVLGSVPQIVNLSSAILTLTGITLDIVPGLRAIQLTTKVLTFIGINSNILLGSAPQAVNLDSVTLTLTGITSDIVPGQITKFLQTASLTFIGGKVYPVLGARVEVNTAVLTISSPQLDIVPGVKVIPLTTGLLQLSGISSTIYAPISATVVSLDPALLTFVKIPLDIIPGQVTINLDSKELILTGITSDIIPGIYSAVLNTATLSIQGITSSVIPGISIVSLDTVSLSFYGITLDIIPGSYTVTLSTSLLNISGINSTISVGGSPQYIGLDTSTLSITPVIGDIIPGIRTITLDTSDLDISGNNITISRQPIIPLNTVTLVLIGVAVGLLTDTFESFRRGTHVQISKVEKEHDMINAKGTRIMRQIISRTDKV